MTGAGVAKQLAEVQAAAHQVAARLPATNFDMAGGVVNGGAVFFALFCDQHCTRRAVAFVAAKPTVVFARARLGAGKLAIQVRRHEGANYSTLVNGLATNAGHAVAVVDLARLTRTLAVAVIRAVVATACQRLFTKQRAHVAFVTAICSPLAANRFTLVDAARQNFRTAPVANKFLVWLELRAFHLLLV